MAAPSVSITISTGVAIYPSNSFCCGPICFDFYLATWWFNKLFIYHWHVSNVSSSPSLLHCCDCPSSNFVFFVCLFAKPKPLLCNCVIMSARVLIRGRTSLVCRSCVLSLYGKLRLEQKTIRLYLYVEAFLLWLQHSGTDGKWSGLILANK